jgi:hypothetical protein
MAKLMLNNDDLAEDFFSDCRLFGIMSVIKNYQLCWQINTQLGYHFRLDPNLEIRVKKKKAGKEKDYFFPVYCHIEQLSETAHYLYHNQYEGDYLLPEFKHVDFLWLIKGGDIDEEICQFITTGVKNLACVQLIAELSKDKIQNKEQLIF